MLRGEEHAVAVVGEEVEGAWGREAGGGGVFGGEEEEGIVAEGGEEGEVGWGWGHWVVLLLYPDCVGSRY